MAKTVKKLINVVNGTFGHLWLNGVEIFAVDSFNLELKLDLEEITGNGSFDVGYKLKKITAEGKFKVQYTDSMGLKDCVKTMQKGKTPVFNLQTSLEDPDQYEGQIECIYIGEAWLENLVVADWEKNKMVGKEFSYKANPMSIDVLKEILDKEGIKIAA